MAMISVTAWIVNSRNFRFGGENVNQLWYLDTEMYSNKHRWDRLHGFWNTGSNFGQFAAGKKIGKRKSLLNQKHAVWLCICSPIRSWCHG